MAFRGIEVYSDADQLARAAAERFATLAAAACEAKGRFTAALSGGSTPRRLYSLLGAPPFAELLPWDRIYLFWGDERCVPPDHEESNFRMVSETLLSKVPIPAENVFRIPAEDSDPHRAATTYSTVIRDFFAPHSPRFDLVFLGMGSDGHTASLFPMTDGLKITDLIAAANFVPKFDAWRITLSAPVINQAHQIIFLVAGDDKASPLSRVIDGERNPELYPSQMISPVSGNLLWMVDTAASRLLSQK